MENIYPSNVQLFLVLVGKSFAQNFQAEVMVTFHTSWLRNKLKGLVVFSIIRLEGKVSLFTGNVLKVFCFLSDFVIEIERF